MVRLHRDNLYPEIDVDVNGRKEKAYGTIPPTVLPGSSVSSGVHAWVKATGEDEDAACYIIPFNLKGSGDRVENMYPLNRSVHESLEKLEKEEQQEIRKHGYTVKFAYEFKYKDEGQRPSQIDQELRWIDSGFTVRHFRREIDNPSNSELGDSSTDLGKRHIRLLLDERTDVDPLEKKRLQELECDEKMVSKREGSATWLDIAAGVAIGATLVGAICAMFTTTDSEVKKSEKHRNPSSS